MQNNKQSLSSFKRKTAEGIDDLRPPDANNRINARWTNDELLLAVQGKLILFFSWSLEYVLQTFYLCESDEVSSENPVFALWDKCVAMPRYIWLYGGKGKYCPRQEHLKRKLLLLSAATLGFKGSVIKVNVEFLNYWVAK